MSATAGKYPSFSVEDDQGRELCFAEFPHAPLVRVQLKPRTRDGVVLDLRALRELHEDLGALIDDLEGR